MRDQGDMQGKGEKERGRWGWGIKEICRERERKKEEVVMGDQGDMQGMERKREGGGDGG